MYRFASIINREQNQIKENKNKPFNRKMVNLVVSKFPKEDTQER